MATKLYNRGVAGEGGAASVAIILSAPWDTVGLSRPDVFYGIGGSLLARSGWQKGSNDLTPRAQRSKNAIQPCRRFRSAIEVDAGSSERMPALSGWNALRMYSLQADNNPTEEITWQHLHHRHRHPWSEFAG